MQLDHAALDEYGRALNRSRRLGREAPAPLGAVEVDADRVRWRRLAATHAAARLPRGEFAPAAWGGLQDSAPRAALLALHARVEDVGPAAWEDPSLVQVWFRWSDYVVPRSDVAVFTVGTLPRDVRQAAALEQLADMVIGAMEGERADHGSLATRLGMPSPTAVRVASPTGRIHIRWDARTTEVIAVERPSMAPEAARLELGRRFLHWLGPASPAQFAKWANVPRPDADATWAALVEELAPVSFAGRCRWMLTADISALVDAESPSGVRLLPMGDPCLYLGDDLPAGPSPLTPDPAAGVTSRLINSLTGRVVAHGQVVGAWGRVQGDVTVRRWTSWLQALADEVEAEAVAVGGAVGRPASVRWLPG